MEVIVLFKGERTSSPSETDDPRLSPAAVLKNHADQSRPAPAALSPALSGPAGALQDLWLVNGYALAASKESLDQLTQDSRVELIVENFTVWAPDVIVEGEVGQNDSVENWGLEKISAPEAWSLFGVTGRGIRIGHLDTGVDVTHPALWYKLAAWAEFDRLGRRVQGARPHDSGFHGTHTAGTLVGGSSDKPLGVAPGARLLSAKVLNGTGGTIAQVIAGMQWVLDPDDKPGTDDGAHILSMSLGAPGQYRIFDILVDRLLGAGVLPVFAIGNSGAGNADAPGNASGAVGVGATTRSDTVAWFSGGAELQRDGQTIIKPELSAPGYAIVSAVPGGRYRAASGTSMATPHVAGVAALLMEAKPGLTPDRIQEILQTTAVDLGPRGLDSRFGYGRVDAVAALASLKGSAIVRGMMANEQGPLPGILRVKDDRGVEVELVPTDPTSGRYAISVPPGRYTLQAAYAARGNRQREVFLRAGDVETVDFVFDPSGMGIENVLVYPNPFKPSRGDSHIHFAGLPQQAFVRVYSLSGALVAEMDSPPGGHLSWNVQNGAGREISSGIYFYTVNQKSGDGGSEHKNGKLAVIR